MTTVRLDVCLLLQLCCATICPRALLAKTRIYEDRIQRPGVPERSKQLSGNGREKNVKFFIFAKEF